jgi:hypothetical protein
VEWHTARPLWDRAVADGLAGTRLKEPVLLRFRSDSFMDELARLLAATPERLAEHVARRESWDAEHAGWVEGAAHRDEPAPHLFQPAHSRFYLLAASLVCRIPGLPDRTVDAAAERVSFVVRRLGPRQAGGSVDPKNPATWREHAWIGDRKEGAWLPLADPAVPPAGEERLPLFSLAFESEGRRHRLHAGLVPAGGREVYEAGLPLAPAPSDLSGDPLADPRMGELEERVIPGLKSLKDTAPAATDPLARGALLFLLLDLTELLARHIPLLWKAIEENRPGDLTGALGLKLKAQPFGGRAWYELLADTAARRAQVLAGNLADLLLVKLAPSAAVVGAAATQLEAGLSGAFSAALPPLPPPPPPPQGEERETFYVARCLYERPLCAPFHDPDVSRPSRPFTLAAFFDPDAPARPLRIRMPVDTSLQGLRRFPKGVSVLLSNELRKQIQRAQNAGLKNLSEGKLGPEPPDFKLGLICSFSIPIITICALILLMIIVQLLNIVFWWLPLFRICLPFPVKAPKGGGS